MKNETKSTGFLAAVMARLTGGDEAKVSRFQAKVVKSYNAQINIRKAEIEDLKEKIADQKEKFEDVRVGVNVEKIKTTEGVDEYIPQYTRSLTAVLNNIKSLEAEIASKEAEIEQFQTLAAALA